MKNRALVERVVAETKLMLNEHAVIDLRIIDNLRLLHAEKAYLAYGCQSFHRFCVDIVGMSDDSAWRRMKAAKLADQFPDVVKPLLAENKVHLTGLALLERVITPENGKKLLAEAVGKSVTQIKAMVAREAPQEGVTGVRKLPRRGAKKQLSERTWQFAAVMNTETKALLTEVEDIGSNADANHILHEALKAYRDVLKVKKQRALKRSLRADATPDTAATAPATTDATRAPALWRTPTTANALTPAPAPTTKAPTPNSSVSANSDQSPNGVEPAPSTAAGIAAVLQTTRVSGAASMRRQHDPTSRNIPAPMERYVRARDGHQCTFVGINGQRCGARRYLQVHHILAVALGGLTLLENLTLHCREHNTYQAELDLGVERANAWKKKSA